MKIKYILFIIISLSLNLLAFGQSKYVAKSQKLYEKGKYQKCIINTKKYLQKERKSADLQYYIVASNFSLYSSETHFTKKYLYLKKSISTWVKLEKYNTDQKDFSNLKDSIIDNIHRFSETESLQRQRLKIKYLHQKLAEVFLDTSDIFLSFQTVAPKQIEIEIDQSVNNIRQTLLENAKYLIGSPYKYGGTDSTGFDCSGFTQYIYKSIGLEIPHNANEQSKLGQTILLSQAQAGDLIFFGNIRAFHAGLIFNNENGKIELIHCVSNGVNHQSHDSENTKYWLQRVYKVQRIIED